MANKPSSTKSGSFPKGGSGKMFSQMSAGPQKPGQTSQEGRGGGSFARGGSGHMASKQSAGPQKEGVTSHEVGGSGKFAQGGSGKMFGKGSSQVAVGGRTAKSAN